MRSLIGEGWKKGDVEKIHIVAAWVEVDEAKVGPRLMLARGFFSCREHPVLVHLRSGEGKEFDCTGSIEPVHRGETFAASEDAGRYGLLIDCLDPRPRMDVLGYDAAYETRGRRWRGRAARAGAGRRSSGLRGA